MRRIVPLFLLITTLGCAGLVFDPSVPTSGGLDRETVIAGLREALRIGSQRAVDRGGVLDGFLANELIRVLIPDELDSMARTLRRVGLDRQVDDLEVAMNRAAEQAVGEARDVFWDEIRTLTIPEAMSILDDGPTGATDHLRSRTAAEIRGRFRPIVVRKMDEVGLSRIYGQLADRYNELPFVSRPAIDLGEYVTDQALDGLFTLLGEEEARIRQDPIARTTELLRRVFGR